MIKLSLEQVIASIKALNPEEKAELQKQLSQILGTPEISTTSNGIQQDQSQNIDSVNFTGNSVTADFSQKQVTRQIVDSQTGSTINYLADMQQILKLLKDLKQSINEEQRLSPSERALITSQVETAERELKRPNPDKDLVSNTVETLKKGLKGIEMLAGPTKRVAELIARSWSIML